MIKEMRKYLAVLMVGLLVLTGFGISVSASKIGEVKKQSMSPCCIYGYVRTPLLEPIEGVQVVAHELMSETDYFTTTDEYGYFSLYDISDGFYTVDFAKDGYSSHMEWVADLLPGEFKNIGPIFLVHIGAIEMKSMPELLPQMK
jgi:hypothetical protein